MEVFTKSFRWGFILFMSLFLVYCSSGIDLDDDDDKYKDDDVFMEATYDITFTKGSDVFHYTQNLSKDYIVMSLFHVGGEILELPDNADALQTVIGTVNTDFQIAKLIVFDKKNVPYSLGSLEKESMNSRILLSDTKNYNFFTSKSGTVHIKNLKRHNTVNPNMQLATYTLEFEGIFDYQSIDNTYEGYTGKGKIVVSQSKK